MIINKELYEKIKKYLPGDIAKFIIATLDCVKDLEETISIKNSAIKAQKNELKIILEQKNELLKTIEKLHSVKFKKTDLDKREKDLKKKEDSYVVTLLKMELQHANGKVDLLERCIINNLK